MIKITVLLETNVLKIFIFRFLKNNNVQFKALDLVCHDDLFLSLHFYSLISFYKIGPFERLDEFWPKQSFDEKKNPFDFRV